MREIRLGLPKGSLNTPDRGNTHEIFVKGGYDIRGYEPGEESDSELSIVNDPEIIAFLTRPQSAPVELSRKLLDAAIIGDDWVQEEGLSNSGNGIRQVGDLEYGQVKMVCAVPEEAPFENLSDFIRAKSERGRPILCFTEYINTARDFLMGNKSYQKIYGDRRPLVQIRGFIDGDNRAVQIINSDGVTEGYIKKGADIVVDNTQTGKMLKRYGLRELEKIKETSTGLYAGPSCVDWKKEKAWEIFELLHGAVAGSKFFDVKFNVPVERTEAVKQFLEAEGLCSDEPTINRGERYSSVNILIPKEVYPATYRTLRQVYGASAIASNTLTQFVG